MSSICFIFFIGFSSCQCVSGIDLMYGILDFLTVVAATQYKCPGTCRVGPKTLSNIWFWSTSCSLMKRQQEAIRWQKVGWSAQFLPSLSCQSSTVTAHLPQSHWYKTVSKSEDLVALWMLFLILSSVCVSGRGREMHSLNGEFLFWSRTQIHEST